ncbi:uncharacterized protein LOC116303930 [Actinia tenebrosa]|uniref:Uncharacterized protein LOC116303930 n=1 Tax=Actinia tenebrosa TaxID=6105 RepID=A0A6P8IR44_ACTTE|nr:uncharacterized protein LOC116303930 [Actinia tenebrosa]
MLMLRSSLKTKLSPPCPLVIDVGAGTWIVGGLLMKDLGYANVDGIDCCEAILQKARDKNIYKNVFVSFVDEKKTKQYFLLFTGGILCFTIRQDSLDQPSYGYLEKFQKLEDEKK